MARTGWIDGTFGTSRGLVRLALSFGQTALMRRADPAAARRIVFVCQGNICRSAYAEAVARAAGMRAASVGLSTTSGLSAHPPVIAAARAMGVDLSLHRTIAIGDFAVEPDDLLLAMEVRQVAKLARDPRTAGAAADLLGRYAGVPHLHDPYRLNDRYLRVCLARIDRAVRALADAAPNARSSR